MELRRIAALDVSAASGLCEVGGELFVVADDELELSVYDLEGRPRRRVALFPGALPEEHGERKRLKPDLEALCVLPDGRLLALGSGSRPERARGALVAGERVEPLELAPLYEALRRDLPELNVEGAAVCGGALYLLSRGNGGGRLNALVEVELDGFVPRRVVPVELPPLAGVALGFTDAAPAGDGVLLFAAAAEDTVDPYLDGRFTGSVIGLLGVDGRVRAIEPVGPHKVEGVTRVGARELRLCTDADDRAAAATLFGAPWPW